MRFHNFLAFLDFLEFSNFINFLILFRYLVLFGFFFKLSGFLQLFKLLKKFRFYGRFELFILSRHQTIFRKSKKSEMIRKFEMSVNLQKLREFWKLKKKSKKSYQCPQKLKKFVNFYFGFNYFFFMGCILICSTCTN